MSYILLLFGSSPTLKESNLKKKRSNPILNPSSKQNSNTTTSIVRNKASSSMVPPTLKNCVSSLPWPTFPTTC